MSQRAVPALLIALLVILHAQLWLGRGSVFHVNQLQGKLQELSANNKAAQLANEQLASEVRDLREGLEMIEGIARSELGMLKNDEILVQYAK
ncbi:MAG: septation ring formation regulator EzrA [Brachymonas sp.]|nr:septation ring formation regulator EzrA [Brachymonas sp.]